MPMNDSQLTAWALFFESVLENQPERPAEILTDSDTMPPRPVRSTDSPQQQPSAEAHRRPAAGRLRRQS